MVAHNNAQWLQAGCFLIFIFHQARKYGGNCGIAVVFFFMTVLLKWEITWNL